jgi:hypothetical protein
VKAYYDRGAPEYDEWYLGLGRLDGLERPQWDDDVRALERTVAALPPATAPVSSPMHAASPARSWSSTPPSSRLGARGADWAAPTPGARALPVLRLKRPVERLAHSETNSEQRQERVLNDGSRWTGYKRYFTGEALARELGGGEVLHESRWFVVVRSI